MKQINLSDGAYEKVKELSKRKDAIGIIGFIEDLIQKTYWKQKK